MGNVVFHCMPRPEKRVAVLGLLGLLGLLGALAAAGVAYAATSDTNLKASVGSTARLSLVDAAGVPVTRLDPGPVELEIEDSTEVHSFHLTGPGNVNVGTGIEDIETKKFALTLIDGRYEFICDAHPLTMKGGFDVGNAPPPPPPPSPTPPPPPSARAPSAPVGATLVLAVGSSAAASLKTVAGKPVTRLRPGRYTVSARDRSAKRGLRLTGAGVARATTAGFVGTKSWKVVLKKGTLTYRAEPQGASGRKTVAVG